MLCVFMHRESASCELKSSFDAADPAAKIELVKDLIAIANSGGGTIYVGRTETGNPGVAPSLITVLDGASLSDAMHRYVNPAVPGVSHAMLPADTEDKAVIEITVDSSGKYPFVISRQGTHAGAMNPVFRVGDVYIRHGAKSEPISYADMVRFVDSAITSFQDEVSKRVQHAVRVPPGTTVVYDTPGGTSPDSPAAMIDLTAARRKRNTGAVVDGYELLWAFSERDTFDLTPERADMLIRSALRRTPTLFFWLAEMDDLDMVNGILTSTLDDADRDKSDAGRAVLEVAAVAASAETLPVLIEGLKGSLCDKATAKATFGAGPRRAGAVGLGAVIVRRPHTFNSPQSLKCNLKHEAVHIWQQRVLGPMKFTVAYFAANAKVGYDRNPFERMAVRSSGCR